MSQEASQFNAQFRETLALARWNEAVSGPNGYNAWFHSGHVRDGGNEVAGQYETELAKLVEVVPLAGGTPVIPDIGVSEPSWVSRHERVGARLTHTYTKIAADGSRIETSRQTERYSWQRDIWNDWRGPTSSLRPAMVGRVCVRWGRLADNFDDLASVVKVYADWMTPDRPEGSAADNSRMGTASMQRSFVIAERDELSYRAAAPYVDALAQLDPENRNHRTVLDVAGLTLRAVMLNLPATRGEAMRTYRPVPQKLAVEAVKTLDERRLLTPGWWMGAVVAAGAITIPSLVPLVHEKLAGDTGADVIAELSPLSSQAFIKTYIATLINAYTKDPVRDNVTSSRIQKMVLDNRGVTDLMYKPS